jgi:hypothetical protein
VSQSGSNSNVVREAALAIVLGLAVGALVIAWQARSHVEYLRTRHLQEGNVFAQWLTAGAAENGQMDLRANTPKLCFIENYWGMTSCILGCFQGNTKAKIRREKDSSDGHWFAAYEIPERNIIYVLAVPQADLVWDGWGMAVDSSIPSASNRCVEFQW